MICIQKAYKDDVDPHCLALTSDSQHETCRANEIWNETTLTESVSGSQVYLLREMLLKGGGILA